MYSIHYERPEGFLAAVEAAGCYLDCHGKFLLLHRSFSSSQGNTWGVPAGKLEKKETSRAAVIREVREEIGLKLDHVEEVGKLFVTLPHISFVFHLFYAKLEDYPEVILSDEHIDARWVTFEDAMKLPLIYGAKEALEVYLDYLSLRVGPVKLE